MSDDSNKVNGLVKNKVVKRDTYDELVNKVNVMRTTDATNFVKETDSQKLVKLRGKFLLIMAFMLLLSNLTI